MSMQKVLIIPTGDEVFEGIIQDTNSPKIMGRLLASFPQAQVLRTTPVRDKKTEIVQVLHEGIQNGFDLILTIGGSGGGGKYSHSLAPDHTHEAILQVAPEASRISIFGYNGHLWSRIVVASVDNSKVITLPGPQVEALAGLEAAISGIIEGLAAEELCSRVAGAVLAQYPLGGNMECS